MMRRDPPVYPVDHLRIQEPLLWLLIPGKSVHTQIGYSREISWYQKNSMILTKYKNVQRQPVQRNWSSSTPLLVEERRGCYVVQWLLLWHIWLLSCCSEASWTAFGTANSLRWLMCSYDSTCDHLSLANLCPKEANHPQFEAFFISRELNTVFTSLGPTPLLGSVHHFTDSLASLFSTKQMILSPFSPVSEGHEDVFDPSSQLPRNVWFDRDSNRQKSCDLVHRTHHSQFIRVPLQAQVFELLSGLQMAFLQVSPESSLVYNV